MHLCHCMHNPDSTPAHHRRMHQATTPEGHIQLRSLCCVARLPLCVVPVVLLTSPLAVHNYIYMQTDHDGRSLHVHVSRGHALQCKNSWSHSVTDRSQQHVHHVHVLPLSYYYSKYYVVRSNHAPTGIVMHVSSYHPKSPSKVSLLLGRIRSPQGFSLSCLPHAARTPPLLAAHVEGG